MSTKSKAECIAEGLQILLGYGRVDVSAEHDELWAAVSGPSDPLSDEDQEAMRALKWLWDEDNDSWYCYV